VRNRLTPALYSVQQPPNLKPEKPMTTPSINGGQSVIRKKTLYCMKGGVPAISGTHTNYVCVPNSEGAGPSQSEARKGLVCKQPIDTLL